MEGGARPRVGQLLAGLAALAIVAAIAIAMASAWRPPPAPAQPAAATLAEQARDRAAALDRQARAATAASERAAEAAADLADRVQRAESAVAAADAKLAGLRSRQARLSARLAQETRPNGLLVAGLVHQARRPALLSLLQPGSLSDAVRLRAVMVAAAPQIEARTSALRQALDAASALEREYALAARQRATASASLLRQAHAMDALAAAERLKAQRAAGSADREAERAMILSARRGSMTALADRITSGASSRDYERRAAVTFPPGYRLPAMGRASAQPSGQLSLGLAPRALVVAPAPGRVTFAGPFRGYGSIVILDHGDGFVSLITGLDTSDVARGQAMLAGSPLGRASANGSPLQLELRRGGQRVDLSSLVR